MQVCTSLQTDNHASTPQLSILQVGCPSCRPTNSVKALKAQEHFLSANIYLTEKSIFTMSIQHNPQNDQLHASASSASQEIAFAYEHQHAICLLACNSAKCSQIVKVFFHWQTQQ